jgi:hypothetical protein
MNVFRLTKHSLVSSASFSKPKNKRTPSVKARLFSSFLSKKGYAFYAFARTSLGFLYSWCTDLKPSIISFWIAIRAKMTPSVWLIRDAIAILATHVKATILPYLWHLHYIMGVVFSPTTTDLPPIDTRLVTLPPSVKKRFGSAKEAFLSVYLTIKQFSKKQYLTTNLIIVSVVIFCSMAFIKRKGHNAEHGFEAAAPSVNEVKNGTSVREFKSSGRVQKTLYSSLVESGIPYSLIGMLEEGLKNKIDLKQCKNGDEYKLIWEQEMIEGQSVGVVQLKSIYFKGKITPEPVYVYHYSNGIASGWFDKKGLPVKAGFIDSPVVNSTITSRFSWNRKHPILGYRRPHLATDYAAPRGTPIMSVADGVVEEARYRVGNGRFVKIKHIPPFETEYLHLSRFGDGIEQGVAVKKKQVIGYIGMSGLTTGPHVCFRFWKGGKAIDHLAERFFTDDDIQQFNKMVEEKREKLDKMN